MTTLEGRAGFEPATIDRACRYASKSTFCPYRRHGGRQDIPITWDFSVFPGVAHRSPVSLSGDSSNSGSPAAPPPGEKPYSVQGLTLAL